MKIYDLLPEGESNAVPRRELVAMTGLSDRELRRKIAAERKEGALILSLTDDKRGGYFKPTPGNAGELRRFISSMGSRGTQIFCAISAAKKALAEMEENEAGGGGGNGR